MTSFKTHLLLQSLREILNSIENDSEVFGRSRSILELKSILRLEIDSLEKEIEAEWVDQPKPSVGVPF